MGCYLLYSGILKFLNSPAQLFYCGIYCGCIHDRFCLFCIALCHALIDKSGRGHSSLKAVTGSSCFLCGFLFFRLSFLHRLHVFALFLCFRFLSGRIRLGLLQVCLFRRFFRQGDIFLHLYTGSTLAHYPKDIHTNKGTRWIGMFLTSMFYSDSMLSHCIPYLFKQDFIDLVSCRNLSVIQINFHWFLSIHSNFYYSLIVFFGAYPSYPIAGKSEIYFCIIICQISDCFFISISRPGLILVCKIVTSWCPGKLKFLRICQNIINHTIACLYYITLNRSPCSLPPLHCGSTIYPVAVQFRNIKSFPGCSFNSLSLRIRITNCGTVPLQFHPCALIWVTQVISDFQLRIPFLCHRYISQGGDCFCGIIFPVCQAYRCCPGRALCQFSVNSCIITPSKVRIIPLVVYNQLCFFRGCRSAFPEYLKGIYNDTVCISSWSLQFNGMFPIL